MPVHPSARLKPDIVDKNYFSSVQIRYKINISIHFSFLLFWSFFILRPVSSEIHLRQIRHSHFYFSINRIKGISKDFKKLDVMFRQNLQTAPALAAWAPSLPSSAVREDGMQVSRMLVSLLETHLPADS